MMGYIMPDNPGVLVPLEGGWYHTGDVVDIDEIGFVFIKDRIKRFAKIGGEMVSLNAVDEMVHNAYANSGAEYSYGVVSVPHESKGEQIVLVTNNKDVTQDGLHSFIRSNGMSELYLPRIILYHDPCLFSQPAKPITLRSKTGLGRAGAQYAPGSLTIMRFPGPGFDNRGFFINF
ncbi:MAG: hypothetical protein ACLU99_14530 [Alphaproteobacteria bacterium]